jgi:Protein of unknown function (DUF2939)
MASRRSIFGLAIVGAGLIYLASPFVAAFEVRQAMKHGDKPTLERRVEWAPVRASLKASLAELQRQADADKQLAGAPPPSIWSRVKAMVMPTMAEKLVDSYVTAEGVIQLFAARTAFKDLKKGLAGADAPGSASITSSASFSTDSVAPILAADQDDQGTPLERFRAFYNRIHRAEFRSPTEVEFEIADRNTPARRFISTFELKSFAWKLTGLKVAGVGF